MNRCALPILATLLAVIISSGFTARSQAISANVSGLHSTATIR